MSDAPRSITEINALASELGPLARTDPAALAARLSALNVREQAELALRLPAKERLELLLHAPKPLALVRALPDGEVYLTVREVGPFDAMPLLALASAAQLVHILDLESWRGDRFDAMRSGAWVALFAEAGEPALRRLLRSADDELLLALFRDWARVSQIEIDHEEPVHGHGETEAGNELGFVSPDGAHRFSPAIPEHAAIVRKVAEVLFLDDQARYRRILWESRMELPAEIEENALRWRQSRLEEHGFPSRDEALAIYLPPTGVASPPIHVATGDFGGGAVLGATRSPLAQIAERSILARAVDRLQGEEREMVLFGIGSLANRVILADAMDPGDPQAHRRAFTKAAAYVDIGLELRDGRDPEAAGTILVALPVIELFREGYARAAALRERARGLVRDGWAARHSRALDLLDAPIRARVRGLLGPHPLYHDVTVESELPYRDFRGIAEVDEARAALDLAELGGRVLLDTIGFPAAAVERGATLSTLLLTALAWHAVRGSWRGEPLPVDVVADFLREIASRKTAARDAPVRALESWLEELQRQEAMRGDERRILRLFGEASLDRLALECGSLDPGTPVTPLSVSCLWLAVA